MRGAMNTAPGGTPSERLFEFAFADVPQRSVPTAQGSDAVLRPATNVVLASNDSPAELSSAFAQLAELISSENGVADIDISAQLSFHKQHGKKATVTAVQPLARYGALDIHGKSVHGFIEKPLGDGGWINGGFFILSPSCIDLIVNDGTSWEGEPLRNLTVQDELMAYQHKGFWQPMDTLRDKNHLEGMWQRGKAPWKMWR